jgi:cytochrome c oxidase subunit 1
MYKGSIRMDPPFVYALSFIFLFAIGGFGGLMLGALSPNVHLHDTYFVVGHFHYVIFGGMGFGLFAAFHYWLPKMTGRMYSKRAAILSWFVLFVGFNLFYFPMEILGWMGMPRRYSEYLPMFADLQRLTSIGAFIMVAGLIAMIANLIRGGLRGAPAGSNPWGGATLEWTLPSPPPAENFETPPLVTTGPYDFRNQEDRK